MKNNELRTIDWKLYTFLKEQYKINPNKRITQEDISTAIPEFTLRESKTTSKKNKCVDIWNSYNRILMSDIPNKIILMRNYTYKIANKEESQKFLKTYFYKQVSPRLLRFHQIKMKIDRDGRGKLLSNYGDPIDETSIADRFYNTYLEEFNK